MEIVTCVLQGALGHRDSMGNGEVLRPGEFQRMMAGTRITHSEFNPSPKIYLSTVQQQKSVQLAIPQGRHVWLQILSGQGVVQGQVLGPGDGLAISAEASVEYQATSESEILVFELG